MNPLAAYIVGIVVAIGVYLLLRGVFCWYWKINARIRLLTGISEKLDRLVGASYAIAEQLKAPGYAREDRIEGTKI